MKYALLFLLTGISTLLRGQMCLGNTTFNNSVLYSPSWISGCATGSSCSGGLPFTNQTSCDSVTTLDSCAVLPSCGPSTNGSDLWFTFYPMDTSAIISVIQNTSFIAGIQAFAPGQGCANLQELGCEVSVGPSGGVALQLNGLVPGQQYFFRVFGSAINLSQRTGIFCFCGTEGLSDGALPVPMRLHAQPGAEAVQLQWTALDDNHTVEYIVERSHDARIFEEVGTVPARQATWAAEYTYHDQGVNPGMAYYRLKSINVDGMMTLSEVVATTIERAQTFGIVGNPCESTLQIEAMQPFTALIQDMRGTVRQSQELSVGVNSVDVHALPSGVYFVRNAGSGDQRRFVVMR